MLSEDRPRGRIFCDTPILSEDYFPALIFERRILERFIETALAFLHCRILGRKAEIPR
jgi:hypothetical protein